jgi:hypothetical protein
MSTLERLTARPGRSPRASRTTLFVRAEWANSKLSPNRMREQILVEAREHYVQMGRNLVGIGEESEIAESVAPPGAIPDGATADTGAMSPALSTS